MAYTQAKTENATRGRIIKHIPVYFGPVYLGGVALKITKLLAENDTVIRRVRMVFADAATSSAAVGVTLMLGTLEDPARFAVWNSPASSAMGAWVEVQITRGRNVLAAGETLTLRTGNGKAKCGTVDVQVDCVETS